MAMAFWQACGAVPVWCLVVCAVVCLGRISGRASGASGNRIAQAGNGGNDRCKAGDGAFLPASAGHDGDVFGGLGRKTEIA